MDIYCDFIQPEHFHRVVWLQVDNGEWWYYTPKSVTYLIQSSDEFFEKVDDGIRDLVKLLHRNGYATTPSCTGHFRSADHYEAIYDILKQDQIKIQSQEVVLTNANQEIVTSRYQDPKYYMPWLSKEQFVEEALKNQTKGILGIVDPGEIIYKAAITNNMSCLRDSDITLLMEYSTVVEEKTAGWDNIIRTIQTVLG